MPPLDADFGIRIDFKRGDGSPRRVFDALSILIDGVQFLDQTAVASIDSHIESLLVLEDIESDSIKIWLRNILSAVDDDVLKTLDWKLVVGKYLVKAKYAVLHFLSDESGRSITDPSEELRSLASDTDIRHLPDYAKPNEDQLLEAVERVGRGTRQLELNDRLFIETEDKIFEVDLERSRVPRTLTGEAELVTQESESHADMILTVRKPDMIGNTRWQFRLGTNDIFAPICKAPSVWATISLVL